MHRRQFVAVLATFAATPLIATARDVEVEPPMLPPDTRAVTWTGIRYVHSAGEPLIRSIEVRVSLWNEAAMAGTVAGSLTANAHTPLPQGEFYHSEVVDWTPELDIEADELTGRAWSTVVGEAAFETHFVQIVAWQNRALTVVLVSGEEPAEIRAEAIRQVELVVPHLVMPCGPMTYVLPEPGDVPEGMVVAWQDGSDPTSSRLPAPDALLECSLPPPQD